MEIEFLKWKPWYQILAGKSISLKTKKKIIEICPLETILAIKEILSNDNQFRIPQNPESQKKVEKFRRIIIALLRTKSVAGQREILKRSLGIRFLEVGLPLLMEAVDQQIKEDGQNER